MAKLFFSVRGVCVCTRTSLLFTVRCESFALPLCVSLSPLLLCVARQRDSGQASAVFEAGSEMPRVVSDSDHEGEHSQRRHSAKGCVRAVHHCDRATHCGRCCSAARRPSTHNAIASIGASCRVASHATLQRSQRRRTAQHRRSCSVSRSRSSSTCIRLCLACSSIHCADAAAHDC